MNVLAVGALVVTGALFAVLYVGYRRGNTTAVINTAAAICVTLVPPALGWALGVGNGQGTGIPAITLWVAVAGFLHCLGMLGRYESVWWWDHVTHTLSAGIVAALLYAGLLVAAGVAPEAPASNAAVAGTLFGTFGLGILWEIGELIAREIADRYDIEPVLVHYGWRDTGLDLLFDVVGAAMVVVLDLRLFVPTVDSVLGAAGIA